MEARGVRSGHEFKATPLRLDLLELCRAAPNQARKSHNSEDELLVLDVKLDPSSLRLKKNVFETFFSGHAEVVDHCQDE